MARGAETPSAKQRIRKAAHQKVGKTMQNAFKKMFAGIRSFWSYMNEGPQSDYERAYLCSVAPMSAEALRGSEEAERGHH